MKNNVIESWWLILLSGLLFMGLGIWIIMSPFKSYVSISLLFAFIICVAGTAELLVSLVSRKNLIGWGWYFAAGIIDIIVGAYLMVYPVVTMSLLAVLFGAWLFYRGVVAIINAFSFHYFSVSGRRWLITSGNVIILLSGLILFNPSIGMLNIIIWTGTGFFLFGIFRIALAFKMKNVLPLR